MRAVLPMLSILLGACGGAPVASGPGPTAVAPTARREPLPVPPDRVPIDALGVLAPVKGGHVSWLVPGRIQLELGGGTAIEAPGGNRPIEVTLVDRQGSLVRAVVRLPHARFSLWTDAARLLAILNRETRIAKQGGAPLAQSFVALHPGARVRKLARKGDQTQIRFVGALEVEGWVPDSSLVESAEPSERTGRRPSGHRTVMLTPGAIIRSEPKWTGGELATLANGYFLDSIQEIDAAWVEVGYSDSDVTVHGYVSRRAPPGRVHRTKDADEPPTTIVPNAKVASGTCLYARRGGDPIGYIVEDRQVQLDDLGGGWWSLAIDTPWGAIPFAARGPGPVAGETRLVACAPTGSVPPPAGTPTP